jgi:hypothetical protein
MKESFSLVALCGGCVLFVCIALGGGNWLLFGSLIHA